jgi:hypothetical protein
MNTKWLIVVAGVSLSLVVALGAGVLIGGIAGQTVFAQGPAGGQWGFGPGMMGRGLGFGAGITGTATGPATGLVTGTYTGAMPCLTGNAGQVVTGSVPYGRGMMSGVGGFGYDSVMLPSLAKALGITETQLQAEFAAGKSVLDIATAKGISAEKLQADFLAAHKAALQQLVKDGKLTQAQADAMQDRADDQDLPCLSGTVTPGQGVGPGGMMGGGVRGGRGMMGRIL